MIGTEDWIEIGSPRVRIAVSVCGSRTAFRVEEFSRFGLITHYFANCLALAFLTRFFCPALAFS
ncbi:hypothetical protein FHS27_003997 [Rhodopirellula rubra]|uniref:Uncharacterized protein n=1 Tax=Aporhodopirellula rubra TaxID=980271 RepID=A0A7W5E138_9BACT|nr:hypothetical protein [Aporhodopirellula rubra]